MIPKPPAKYQQKNRRRPGLSGIAAIRGLSCVATIDTGECSTRLNSSVFGKATWVKRGGAAQVGLAVIASQPAPHDAGASRRHWSLEEVSGFVQATPAIAEGIFQALYRWKRSTPIPSGCQSPPNATDLAFEHSAPWSGAHLPS